MTREAPPEVSGAPRPTARPGLRRAAPVALRRGLLAFAIVTLAGQLFVATIDLFGGGLALSTTWSLGWLYTLAFHRVGLDVVVVGDAAGATGTTYGVSIALLTGTGLALWLLYRGGLAAAERAGSSMSSRVLAGVLVAPAYAVPIALITSVTHLQLRGGGGLLPDVVRVQGVVWQALALPAGLAIVAGGLGGAVGTLSEASRPYRWLVGGLRMLLLALGLAFVGILALSAVRPEGLAAYVRGLSANGARIGLLLAGNHALLLPNQSFLVLAPAMGGCVGLRGSAATVPLVCPGRLPVLGVASVSADIAAAGSGGPVPASRSMPAGYWAFAIVPAVVTVAGGRWASAGIERVRDRLTNAVGAGVVFGLLVGTGAWASGVEVGKVERITFGAPAFATGLLALAWGVAGGTIGALLPRAQEAPGPAEPPPSPTSV